jgi:hypothetical protein
MTPLFRGILWRSRARCDSLKVCLGPWDVMGGVPMILYSLPRTAVLAWNFAAQKWPHMLGGRHGCRQAVFASKGDISITIIALPSLANALP